MSKLLRLNDREDHLSMKATFTLLIALAPAAVLAQVFYVEPTEKGYEKEMIENMRYDGYKVVEQKQSSEYTIRCFVRQSSKLASAYRGYLLTIENTDGAVVARSEEFRTTATLANGYNAAGYIFKKIYKKQFAGLVSNLSK